jgi:hypothetical protein
MKSNSAKRGARLWISVASVAFLIVACQQSDEGPAFDVPITESVIVKSVDVSEDGDRVEAISISNDAGDQFTVSLSQDIDPQLWGPRHLLGHVESGKLKIGIKVTYIRTEDGFHATALSE